MPGDVFEWPMNAELHKEAVDTLREEVIEAHQADPQRPVPIALIFALLPIESDQVKEVTDRGDFTLSGDRFENRTNDALVMELSDPVLKTFDVTLPAALTGTLVVEPPKLTINFEPALEIELDRLAELGVDRSKFQELTTIEVTPDLSLSILREATGEHRETWIQAQLVGGARPRASLMAAITTLGGVSSIGDGCDSPEQPIWHVYKTGNKCIIHKGRVGLGETLGYEHQFGPDTWGECRQWTSRNCERDENGAAVC